MCASLFHGVIYRFPCECVSKRPAIRTPNIICQSVSHTITQQYSHNNKLQQTPSDSTHLILPFSNIWSERIVFDQYRCVANCGGRRWISNLTDLSSFDILRGDNLLNAVKIEILLFSPIQRKTWILSDDQSITIPKYYSRAQSHRESGCNSVITDNQFSQTSIQ